MIIALSSDEEDDNDKSQASSSSFGSGFNGSQNNSSQQMGPFEPINRKEPVITADMENYEDCEEEKGPTVTGKDLTFFFFVNIWKPDFRILENGFVLEQGHPHID